MTDADGPDPSEVRTWTWLDFGSVPLDILCSRHSCDGVLFGRRLGRQAAMAISAHDHGNCELCDEIETRFAKAEAKQEATGNIGTLATAYLNETEIIDQSDVNPDPSELRTWLHFGSVTLDIQGIMEQKPDGTWESRTRRLYIVEAYLEP